MEEDLLNFSNFGTLSRNLAAKLFALQTFCNDLILPPRNTCWAFLLLYQIILEKVAIEYPAACDFNDYKKQNIEELINNDLTEFCQMALPKKNHTPITKNDAKGIKV